jgi:hypothetical protein
MRQEVLMADAGALATIASTISGFGGAMLVFRIQRELQMHDVDEITWIPWSDRLLVLAIEVSLLFVLVPLLIVPRTSRWTLLAPAACSAACVLVAGFILSILAYYRLIFGRKRSGPRTNPEPAERAIVLLTAATAVIVFGVALIEAGFSGIRL